ncbi:uncharacterized protein LOC107367163 [Tetranychus urticae]|nr:uncharacterized protein LOC107367163 [Tetranychus urticae]
MQRDELHVNLSSVIADQNICLEGPKRLGYFSFYCNAGNESVYCPDQSSLRYLDLPNPIYINALQGYDKNIKYGLRRSKNKQLLRWILQNETIVRNFTHDFICSNGVLKDIMIFPYRSYGRFGSNYGLTSMNISAVKIRGKIILDRCDSTAKKMRIDVQSERDNLSTYAGFNLQRLITKNNNHSQCASGKENDSFYGVFHSNIGTHGIIHAGYLDCVESQKEMDKPFDEMKFVLIKKHNAPKRNKYNEYDETSHPSKYDETWWSLATLAGVDTIIHAKCEQGFRVKNINKIIVSNIIDRERQKQLLTTLNKVLDFVKSIVKVENQYYNFYFNCTNRKLTGYMRIDSIDIIIPSWYTDGQLPNES